MSTGSLPCERAMAACTSCDAALVEALEAKRARWVEWWPDLEFPEGPGDHLGPFRTYLHAHYHIATTLRNGDQLWERNE